MGTPYMREVEFKYRVGEIVPVDVPSGSIEIHSVNYEESARGSHVSYVCWTRTTAMKYLLLTESEIEGLRTSKEGLGAIKLQKQAVEEGEG